MSFEIWQDSDGPALVATASSQAEALAIVAALSRAVPLDDLMQTTDAAQLVFLAAVLDDVGLRLVMAWEPQTAMDGSIGIFEHPVTNPA